MSELLYYDNHLVEALKHIEDIQVKFSLQNYASAGAVYPTHFTAIKLDIGTIAFLVLVLGLVFLCAICSNYYRYKRLYDIHRIVRGRWLNEQKELRNALFSDAKLKEFLTTPLSFRSFLPMFVINALPALSAAVVYYRPSAIG